MNEKDIFSMDLVLIERETWWGVGVNLPFFVLPFLWNQSPGGGGGGGGGGPRDLK